MTPALLETTYMLLPCCPCHNQFPAWLLPENPSSVCWDRVLCRIIMGVMFHCKRKRFHKTSWSYWDHPIACLLYPETSIFYQNPRTLHPCSSLESLYLFSSLSSLPRATLFTENQSHAPGTTSKWQSPAELISAACWGFLTPWNLSTTGHSASATGLLVWQKLLCFGSLLLKLCLLNISLRVHYLLVLLVRINLNSLFFLKFSCYVCYIMNYYLWINNSILCLAKHV